MHVVENAIDDGDLTSSMLMNSQSLLLYTEQTPFPHHHLRVRHQSKVSITASCSLLHTSLALALLKSALRLALELRSLALRLASKLVRLAGSGARDLVGLALRLSGAEAGGLLDLLCHLAGLLDALDGGTGDAAAVVVLGLSEGLW